MNQTIKNNYSKRIKNYASTYIPFYIWDEYKIQRPIREYQFTRERKFRLDYAWPNKRVAVEIEGGIWINGRHVRPEGYIKDMEKYNILNELGWILLRYEPKCINYMQIKRVLSSRGETIDN